MKENDNLRSNMTKVLSADEQQEIEAVAKNQGKKNIISDGGKEEIMTSKYYGKQGVDPKLLEINLTSAITVTLQGQKRSDTARISIL